MLTRFPAPPLWQWSMLVTTDSPSPVPSPQPFSLPPLATPKPGSHRLRRAWRLVGIVSALLILGASFAFPTLCAARSNANESAAIASLKNISSAQAQMQASGFLDVNGNGGGEYGFFAELSGSLPVRTKDPSVVGAKVDPPLLPRRFAKVVHSRVRSGGYMFQMFLRGPDGVWVAEANDGGGMGCPVDPVKAETEWLCYAWPIVHGSSGKRAFMISQSGDVLASNLSAVTYSGEAGPFPGLAAFLHKDGVWRLAANEVDTVGNTWGAV